MGGGKRVGVTAQGVAAVLVQDLTTDGGYFVSGRLTPEIFTDDCRFKVKARVRVTARVTELKYVVLELVYQIIRLPRWSLRVYQASDKQVTSSSAGPFLGPRVEGVPKSIFFYHAIWDNFPQLFREQLFFSVGPPSGRKG